MSLKKKEVLKKKQVPLKKIDLSKELNDEINKTITEFTKKHKVNDINFVIVIERGFSLEIMKFFLDRTDAMMAIKAKTFSVEVK